MNAPDENGKVKAYKISTDEDKKNLSPEIFKEVESYVERMKKWKKKSPKRLLRRMRNIYLSSQN